MLDLFGNLSDVISAIAGVLSLIVTIVVNWNQIRQPIKNVGTWIAQLLWSYLVMLSDTLLTGSWAIVFASLILALLGIHQPIREWLLVYC